MTDAITATNGLLAAMDALTASANALIPQIPQPAAAPAGQPSFSEIFNAAVNRLDDSVAAADSAVGAFASGTQDIPLSDVMISLEEAGLALQMAATVRDKVLAAYTNIMNMPV
jgi:flagellar hook-basal body complex protein FliE